MLKIKNVIVGISGGVDSAVTALLLKNKGFNVKGVFMQNWDIADETGVCSADRDYKDASVVCNKLNIPLIHVNFVKEYWNEVFVNLIKEYEAGYTPNPDVLCNRKLKFNHFYRFAFDKLGADAIATGHYAATSFGPYLEHYEPDKAVRLLIPEDKTKDQTLFLCQVEQEALRKTMFPLGELTKREVKMIANENGLEAVAAKKESMGICFIGSRNFQNFISEYVPNKEGDFIDIDTKRVVGRHNGIHLWTVGQRSRIGGASKCYFVCEKHASTNTIYVALGPNHPALYSQTFLTSKPHWIAEKPQELQKRGVLECQFKFQHTYDLEDCEVFDSDSGLIVRLLERQKAITEGQYAVFYKDGECLGSGKICFKGVPNYYRYWVQNRTQLDVYGLIRKEKNRQVVMDVVKEAMLKYVKSKEEKESLEKESRQSGKQRIKRQA